jgi:hypothetical protein
MDTMKDAEWIIVDGTKVPATKENIDKMVIEAQVALQQPNPRRRILYSDREAFEKYAHEFAS